ncbi:MAG: hypothetical protein JNL74_05110 [Fibrobacteres bacterium]|nr:hypothetical protein [Fibrobacterota bacterium]
MKAVFQFASLLLISFITAYSAPVQFAEGGTGGNYLSGSLWTPPKSPEGLIYRKDIAALPPNTFVRIANSKLVDNIDTAYKAVGRGSVAGTSGTFDYSGMAWDNEGKRGFAFGGGHATTGGNGVHQLDVVKGKWVPAVYESYPGYKGYTQNDADFLMKSTNESYSKGLFVVTKGDLSKLHDSGAVVVKSFAAQSPKLYARPFARSSTGFAVKIQGNPWGTAFVEAPGPEGFVTTQAGYDSIFPDTNNARPQIKTEWGNLWDGPMCSWHSYYFQAYIPKQNMFLVSAYGSSYWAYLNGNGWADKNDSVYAPFNTYLSINSWGGLSATRLVYDTTRNKIWFGSHTGNSANYWYTDAARLSAMGIGGQYWFWSNRMLSYDLKTKTWGHKQLASNTNHTYWSAGNRFGDMGYGNNPGHCFNMTNETDSSMDFGDSATGKYAHNVTHEGYGAAYFENQGGKMWGFAGGTTALVTEYSMDSGIRGAGRNNSIKIPATDITSKLVNITDMISNATVGVYNRMQYFPAESLLVVCVNTKKEIYFCRVDVSLLSTKAETAVKTAPLYTLSAAPMPFTSGIGTTIKLSTASPAAYSLYSPDGRLVRSFKNLKAGTSTIRWNGTSESGARMASGIYVGRMVTSDGKTIEHRLAIMK